MNSSMSDFIDKLKKAIDEAARGNLDVKIESRSNDDTQKLAESFNELIKSFKTLKAELEEVNELRFKSEIKYRNLYDNAPDLYRSVNAAAEIIDCNRAYAERLGYAKEEVIGMPTFDHTAERSIDDLHDMIKIWQREGRVVNKEIWLKRKNGSIFPVLLSSNGLYNENGKLVGSNTVMKDMTDIYEARKKIEEDQTEIKKQLEELKEANELRFKSELKYRNLYDNSPDLLRSVNGDGIIIDCNNTYAKKLGYTKEEIIGKYVREHIAENSLKDFEILGQKWKKEGKVSNVEIWIKRKDGSTFPALLSSTGIHDEHGNIIGSNTVIRDITEIHNARKK